MTDNELNQALWDGLADMQDNDGLDIQVQGLSHYGKRVPYIGWYWREVDFADPALGNSGSFIGFMENNKWDYDFVMAQPEQVTRIRELMVAYVEAPTTETAQAIFDFMQTLG